MYVNHWCREMSAVPAKVALMKDGVASQTARRVAARRLTYQRVPADYGQPEADIALMRDVAAGLEASPGRMHEYIRARTAFFDRVVVRAVGSGVRQVVVGAAGYDGRSRHPELRAALERLPEQDLLEAADPYPDVPRRLARPPATAGGAALLSHGAASWGPSRRVVRHIEKTAC